MILAHLQPNTRPYLDLSFPPAPSLDRPYVIINMVGSIDGKAVIGSSERGLGSDADKQRMQELRAHADAVLNGSATVRESGASSRIRDAALIAWRREHGKQSDHPLGAILSKRAEFPLKGAYFNGSGIEAIVFASEATAERRVAIEAHGAKVVAISPGPENAREALAYLRRERDVSLLLCEGGPNTNAALLRLGLVDEFFLTLSATLVGGMETLTVLEGDAATAETVARMTLLSAIANDETNELYLRYRL